jgi:hypothetical protein
MLRRVMVVVLFGCVGLAAGVAYAALFKPSYEVSEAIRFVPTGVCGCVPDGTTLRRLGALTRSHHPGVQVTVARSVPSVYFSATGSIPSAEQAVSSAAKDIIAPLYIGGPKLVRGIPAPVALGNAVPYGLLGLLAGVSAALGFLVPPKS